MSVTQSVLLYGSEMWADALKKEKFRKKIGEVQYRGALKVMEMILRQKKQEDNLTVKTP